MVNTVHWFKTSKMMGVKIVTNTTTKIINLDFVISYAMGTNNVITLTLTNGTVETIDFGNLTTNKDVYDKLETFLCI